VEKNLLPDSGNLLNRRKCRSAFRDRQAGRRYGSRPPSQSRQQRHQTLSRDCPTGSFGCDPMNQAEHDVRQVISGRKVVVAMFALGIVATIMLWTYWKLRLMPFMPMQEALVVAFPGSSPRVEDGRAKISGAEVLQVVMRSDFDPTDDSENTRRQVDSWLMRTRDIAEERTVLSNYDVLAVHLYFPVQEKELRQRTFFRELETWKELDVNEVMVRKRD